MQSLGFPPSSSKIKRSNNSWQRKLFWFYFFHDLLKFCPFLNHEEQNVGFFSKEKCVYIWKYALGCIINKACEQQESEIQKLIFLQCQYHWEAGGVTPHPEVFFPEDKEGRMLGLENVTGTLGSTVRGCAAAQVVFAPATRLLGHVENTPELRDSPGTATPGLCAWSQQWIRLPVASTGTLWMCTSLPASRVCPSAWKKRGNILLVFKGVSCTLISTRLMGLWSSRWGHGVLSDVERGELRHCNAPAVLPVCSLALWRS